MVATLSPGSSRAGWSSPGGVAVAAATRSLSPVSNRSRDGNPLLLLLKRVNARLHQVGRAFAATTVDGAQPGGRLSQWCRSRGTSHALRPFGTPRSAPFPQDRLAAAELGLGC